MPTAISAAKPNVRIRAESAKANETMEMAWFIAVSRHAGATSSTALRAASMRSMPDRMSRRIDMTRCIESEKPETRISGVMTLMKRLRRKSSAPSTPRVQKMAMAGPSTAMMVSDRRPEE